MLCDGNLKQCKMNEQLTNEQIYSIIDRLVDTLEELKKNGKCHNDVKPGNVFICEDKKSGRATANSRSRRNWPTLACVTNVNPGYARLVSAQLHP